MYFLTKIKRVGTAILLKIIFKYVNMKGHISNNSGHTQQLQVRCLKIDKK